MKPVNHEEINWNDYIDGIDLLANDLGLADTVRTFQEKHDPYGF